MASADQLDTYCFEIEAGEGNFMMIFHNIHVAISMEQGAIQCNVKGSGQKNMTFTKEFLPPHWQPGGYASA